MSLRTCAGWLLRCDHTISRRLQDQRRRFYPFFWLGAHLGDGWLWFSLAGLSLWRARGRLRDEARHWLIVSLLASAVTVPVKFLARRKRPQSHSGFYSRMIDKHSFPSGHATRMGTLLVWGSLCRPAAAPFLLLLAVWVGLSRVALGVHYLSDVVAGMAIGGCVAALWDRRVRKERDRG